MMPLTARGLFWLFLRIGNLTFGGGDPTMAAMQQELFSRRWLSHEDYGLIYALARITPGTNVLAFCAGAGWRMLGWTGALLAVAAVSLPSSILVTLLSAGYRFWQSNPVAMAMISGMLAAAIGMMMTGAFQLLRPHFRRTQWLRAAVISATALVLSVRFGMTPVQVLALAAITGFLWRPAA